VSGGDRRVERRKLSEADNPPAQSDDHCLGLSSTLSFAKMLRKCVFTVSSDSDDLRSGAQRLDVRFIQFDNVVVELLQYRAGSRPPLT